MPILLHNGLASTMEIGKEWKRQSGEKLKFGKNLCIFTHNSLIKYLCAEVMLIDLVRGYLFTLVSMITSIFFWNQRLVKKYQFQSMYFYCFTFQTNYHFQLFPRYFWKLVVDLTTRESIVFVGLNHNDVLTISTQFVDDFCDDQQTDILFDGMDNQFLGKFHGGYIYACRPEDLVHRIREIPLYWNHRQGADSGLQIQSIDGTWIEIRND